ncbi:hypothetical protein [Bacteroides sp.]|uniref:hypothetical protein n=1 Tax=Bacteroides sp. TaxID=29523 RepID=UPI001B4E59BC|nr:hypothetical protein [Bacteroides sp.]MBP8623132.1 hypothetical protein [Bacteroides sp.]
MKIIIRNYAKVLLLLVTMLGAVSCQDEESIAEQLLGRTWVGDLGFSDNGYALESGLTFKSNGFGLDEQYYYNNLVEGFFEMQFRWMLNGYNLRLDYGDDRYGRPLILEIREVHIDNRVLYGVLYENNKYRGDVELVMD